MAVSSTTTRRTSGSPPPLASPTPIEATSTSSSSSSPPFASSDRPIFENIPGVGTLFLRRDRFMCKRRRAFSDLGRSQRAKVARLAHLAIESVCDALCPGHSMDLLDAIIEVHQEARQQQQQQQQDILTSTSPSWYDKGPIHCNFNVSSTTSATPTTTTTTTGSNDTMPMALHVATKLATDHQWQQPNGKEDHEGTPGDNPRDGLRPSRKMPYTTSISTTITAVGDCTTNNNSRRGYCYYSHESGGLEDHHQHHPISHAVPTAKDYYKDGYNSQLSQSATSTTSTSQYDMIPPSPYLMIQLPPLPSLSAYSTRHYFYAIGAPGPLLPRGTTPAKNNNNNNKNHLFLHPGRSKPH